MVLTIFSNNDLRFQLRNGSSGKLARIDKLLKRRNNLQLKDGIPKYFWEFQEKHALNASALSAMKEVDQWLLDDFIFSLKEKGKTMFRKLFAYTPEAEIEVIEGPYTVLIEKEKPKDTTLSTVLNKIRSDFAKADSGDKIVGNQVTWTYDPIESRYIDEGPTCLLRRRVHSGLDVMIVINPTKKPTYSISLSPRDLKGYDQWVRDLTREGIEPNPGPRNKNSKKLRPRRNIPTKPQSMQRRYQRRVPEEPRRLPPRTDDFPLYRQRIQPDNMICELVFDLLSAPFNNPGGSIVSEIFNANDAYDWLPSILTPTMQFLNRQFAVYAKAKVISTRWVLTFTNLEQTEIDINFFSAPQAITSIAASKTAIQNAAGTGTYRGGLIMSEQYGKQSKITFTDNIKTARVIGNSLQFKATDDFSFTQSSGPVRTTYYGWFASTPLATMATGITRRVRIYSRIFFYEKLSLTSALLQDTNNDVNPRSTRDVDNCIEADPTITRLMELIKTKN